MMEVCAHVFLTMPSYYRSEGCSLPSFMIQMTQSWQILPPQLRVEQTVYRVEFSNTSLISQVITTARFSNNGILN